MRCASGSNLFGAKLLPLLATKWQQIMLTILINFSKIARVKPHITLILLAFAAFSAPALALEPSSHGKSWPQIVEPLLRAGITKIGPFDLQEFHAKAQQVKWWQLKNTPESVKSGSRRHAYYDKGSMNVQIAESLPPEAVSYQAELELHEALGAVGEEDGDYQKSTALRVLANTPAGEKRDLLLKNYASLFAVLKKEGGTGVSGGGDSGAVVMKNAVLARINEKQGDTDFLALYPWIAFEPLRKGEAKEVTLTYTYLAKSAAKERLKISFPLKRWQQGERARASLIEDAAEKITAIFPSRSGSARSFRPSACEGANQLVSYPATNDREVAKIQDFRGAILLGCKKIFAELDSRSITTSQEKKELSPRSSGLRYFHCRFDYRGNKLAKTLQVAAGGRSLNELRWGLEQGDYLGGNLIVGENGRIESTFIQYASPEGARNPLRFDQSADGKTAESRLKVKGAPLSFRCEASERE